MELFIVNFFCAQHHNPHFTLSYCILNDANMTGVFSRIEHKNVNMLCCNSFSSDVLEKKRGGSNSCYTIFQLQFLLLFQTFRFINFTSVHVIHLIQTFLP